MVSYTALSLLALAGAAAAHPAKHTVIETVVVTKYVTIPYGGHAPQTSSSFSAEGAYIPKPKPSSSSSPAYAPAPVVTPSEPAAYQPAPKPTWSPPAYQPAPKPTWSPPAYQPAPRPTPSPPAYQPAPPHSPSAAPPPPPPSSTKEVEQPKPTEGSGSGGSGYMGTVNTWRATMGMSNLAYNSTLEANAAKCAEGGKGQMVHHLFDGTYGQVLAPGKSDNFESVFVGGWLCEDRSLPGLGAKVCNKMEKGWDHSNGDKGHAEILTSDQYSQIGCAYVNGIWDCDLA